MSSPIPIPTTRDLEFPRQQDVREFVLVSVEGHPPERQKKLIMEARAAGLLDDGDTASFLDACGLREA